MFMGRLASSLKCGVLMVLPRLERVLYFFVGKMLQILNVFIHAAYVNTPALTVERRLMYRAQERIVFNLNVAFSLQAVMSFFQVKIWWAGVTLWSLGRKMPFLEDTKKLSEMPRQTRDGAVRLGCHLVTTNVSMVNCAPPHSSE